jgi:hypothetical protein
MIVHCDNWSGLVRGWHSIAFLFDMPDGRTTTSSKSKHLEEIRLKLAWAKFLLSIPHKSDKRLYFISDLFDKQPQKL